VRNDLVATAAMYIAFSLNGPLALHAVFHTHARLDQLYEAAWSASASSTSVSVSSSSASVVGTQRGDGVASCPVRTVHQKLLLLLAALRGVMEGRGWAWGGSHSTHAPEIETKPHLSHAAEAFLHTMMTDRTLDEVTPLFLDCLVVCWVGISVLYSCALTLCYPVAAF
jgi:hypothetical protein